MRLARREASRLVSSRLTSPRLASFCERLLEKVSDNEVRSMWKAESLFPPEIIGSAALYRVSSMNRRSIRRGSKGSRIESGAPSDFL